MKLPFGRRITAMLPYALAFFILFFLAGLLLTTAITEMGVTSPVFTTMAVPLACGALAFLGALGVAMAEDAKEAAGQ